MSLVLKLSNRLSSEISSRAAAALTTCRFVNNAFPALETTTRYLSTEAGVEDEDVEPDNKNDTAAPDFFNDNAFKSGTPSPWAVFDAWGASGDIHAPLSPQDHSKLTREAVRIEVDETTSSDTPSETEILTAYDQLLKSRSSVHFGYPYNLSYNHEELYNFMRYSINNLGDPFVPSNYGVHSRQFECAVIDFFSELFKADPEDIWGHVTTCGTEGNLHGILLARECHPDAILYSSRESHYSIFKAARYYRMDAKSIPTLPMGEIDYSLLERELAKNLDRPAIINVNIGTTVKGAVDNLDRILRVLQNLNIPRERYHIHCDGALFAMMMPFIDHAPDVSFKKPIDSISVSGHKMLGCPMPCGIALTRKEHVKKVEHRIDYLNSVDTTIIGSRNGESALYLWYSLRKKSVAGIKKDVLHCLETAKYLREQLSSIGIDCRLNDLSTTVVLERPLDDDFIKRWQLACEEDIAHVVVMPNITKSKIDQFVKELKESVEEHGRIKAQREGSPLTQLFCSSWGGAYEDVNDLKSDS
mmetsp:Transcript_7545/g.11818  ORF Transcript_7545/g.11818 Transcript_7545/m.11818 type:complete len:529 (-) Transcript_7545:148-1734(-)